MSFMECEVPEFYTTSERVARKAHKCCECGAKIHPGEKYLLCAGKWDGEVETYRQHSLCAAACMFIRNEFNDGECIAFGGLFDWVGDSDVMSTGWASDPITMEFRRMFQEIKRREEAKP